MIGVALATRDLVKRYGRRRALDGFTLAVPRGTMMGLVGANGAGKTTWMMAVAGFLRLTSGTIDLLGRGPFDAAVHAGRFAILPQDVRRDDAFRPPHDPAAGFRPAAGGASRRAALPLRADARTLGGGGSAFGGRDAGGG